MATSISTRSKRSQREQRIFAITLGLCTFLTFSGFAWIYGSTYVAYWKYSPQDGDILFQSLPHSPLINAIEGVTDSPYSHCAIVAKLNNKWVVYEAYRNVEVTPLREFVFRGRNQGFAVYRFKGDYQKYIPATIENTRQYLGRPYDSRYRMDDERIYCTELIYKAYKESSGKPLGKFVRLGDLNWHSFEETITHYEGGPVPVDREMITPKGLAESRELELVFAHNIARVKP